MSRDSSAGSWRRTCAGVHHAHASRGARGAAAGDAMVTARRGQTGSAQEEGECNFCVAFAVTDSIGTGGRREGEIFFRCASRFGVALADAAMDGGGIGTGDSGGW